MRAIFFTLLLVVTVFSNQRDDFVENYKNKNYNQACFVGKNILEYYREDEDFISAYGFACLYSDNIDLIAPSVMYLKNTKEGRQNAAFLSSIVAMKKILYMSVVDGVDIKTLNLPKLDHVLSDVFHMYVAENFTMQDGMYIFNVDEKERIVMENRVSGEKAKLYIQKFVDNKLIKTHVYW